jgi:hypothetical protein
MKDYQLNVGDFVVDPWFTRPWYGRSGIHYIPSTQILVSSPQSGKM